MVFSSKFQTGTRPSRRIDRWWSRASKERRFNITNPSTNGESFDHRLFLVPNGHETVAVEAMAVTADGTLLVSAGREGKLVLSAFDGPDSIHEVSEIDTAQRVQTRADSAALLAITISPDGRTLAAAGEEGPIGLWDITDPSRPRQIGATTRGDLPT